MAVELSRPQVAVPPGVAYGAAALCGLLALASVKLFAEGEVDAGAMGLVVLGGLTWFFTAAGRRATRVEAGRLELATGYLRLDAPYPLRDVLEVPLHGIEEVVVGERPVRGAHVIRARGVATPNLTLRFREPLRLPLRSPAARLRRFSALAFHVDDPARVEALLSGAARVTPVPPPEPLPPRERRIVLGALIACQTGVAVGAAWVGGLIGAVPGVAGLVLLVAAVAVLRATSTAAASSAP